MTLTRKTPIVPKPKRRYSVVGMALIGLAIPAALNFAIGTSTAMGYYAGIAAMLFFRRPQPKP